MQPPADLNAALRQLPKVDEVLASPSLRDLLERVPRWAVVAAVRDQIDQLREQLRARLTAGHVAESASGVEVPGQQKLSDVAFALGTLGILFGLRERRQQHGCQNGDDGNDHQLFNQGEGVTPPPPVKSSL